MNVTYTMLELRRIVRDPINMFFTAVLPAFFYLVFGAAQDFATEDAGNGNVAMYIMVSMAAYGALTATVSIGGSAAVERMQGWGRQLGLTPMRDPSYVASKAFVAVAVALVPILLVFALGRLTGAEGTATAWVLAGLVVVAGACIFALYGLCFGLAIRSESAIGAASGSIVILAFLGNLFFPLSGTLLSIAKFTPLYGYVSLARYPVTEGANQTTSDGQLISEPLWVPLLNVAVWTAVLALVAKWLVRRSRGRQ